MKSHLLAVVMVAASLLGGLALVAGEGCTVLTNDALPDDAGIFEGGDATAEGACNTCLAAACLGPAALCLTSDACAGVVDCNGDAGCVCAASNDGGPSPDRLHHAYTSCFDDEIAACATECAAENRSPSTTPACASDAGATDATDAGDAGDAGPVDAGTTGTAACVACANTNCAAAVASCGSGSECEAFLSCSSACTTGSCITDCGTLHATGKVAASELATCTATSCKNDCGL